MNPLATALNETIEHQEPAVAAMLAPLGRALFYPRGILSQTAEAKQKAHRYNATIGIARQDGHAMALPAVLDHFAGLSADEVLPYAPATGHPTLRQRWLQEIRRKNPALGDRPISLPIVTSGLTGGLSLAADLFVGPGDRVLLPDQFWGNYNMTLGVRHGAELVKYPFYDGEGFNVSGLRDALRAQPAGGKAIVLLNFPNNPTGYSLSTTEAQQVSEVLREAAEAGLHLVVLCDDAYFGLFYEPQVYPESLFGLLAGRHERLLAVKLDGATKEDFVWGFRVGFITFATGGGHPEVLEALEKKTGGAIRGSISNCPLPSQTILLHAMNDPDYLAQKQAKRAVLQERALKVKQEVHRDEYADLWTAYPFNSGYFMCIRLHGLDAESYRLRLLDDYQIGTIATGPHDIRVAFSCVETDQIATLFADMADCARKMTG